MEDTRYTRRLPRVLNKKEVPRVMENMVYIGRPSKWGNPFRVQYKNGVEVPFSRMSSIIQYEEYLQMSHSPKDYLHELRGKDLVCFCAPLACHGDILIRYANRVYCPHCNSLEIGYTTSSPEYLAEFGEEVTTYALQGFDGNWNYISERYDSWSWLNSASGTMHCMTCGLSINVEDYYNSNFNMEK